MSFTSTISLPTNVNLNVLESNLRNHATYITVDNRTILWKEAYGHYTLTQAREH